MALQDDDPSKWCYPEHTKVKHEILGKYLRGWTCILGNYYSRICFFDCFAGRGTYFTEDEDNSGSPLRALRIAKHMQKNYHHYVFTFIEKNKNNYENLLIELEKEGWDKQKITVNTYNNEFSTVAQEMFDYYKEKNLTLAPSFFFIDPFGYKGIPFTIVKNIFSYQRTEVLFTFMTRDITRFLTADNNEIACNELFGDDSWKNAINKKDKEHALVELYIEKLKKEANVKFILPFRVGADEIRSTTYYLIHASTNFKAFKLMKEIAYKKSRGRFSFFGPDEQITPLTMFDNTIPKTKDYLLEKFPQQELKFSEIIEITYPDKAWIIEGDLKKALKELNNEKKIIIDNAGKKGGLKPYSNVKFL
jgi:three-Cys-motif partner protein